MKKVLALGATTVCALGVMGGAFAAEETPIEALYNIDESYTVTFPAEIEFDDYEDDQFATVKAEDVLLNDGNKLKITMVSTNGALKNEVSSITYTIKNGEGEKQTIVANTPFDILVVESGNRDGDTATLTFTSGDDTEVTLAGKHSDTLTFKVEIDDGIAFMQDIDAAMKAKIASGEIAVLKDRRDNKQYSVAKFGDDIWMTRNLRYTANDIAGWSDGIITSEAGYTYYTWTAALTSDEKNDSDPNSVCPKNWTLPFGGFDDGGQLGALVALSEDDSTISELFNITDIESYVYGSEGEINPNHIGEDGYIWSSTQDGDQNRGHVLQYNEYGELSIEKGDDSFRYFVRCVAVDD